MRNIFAKTTNVRKFLAGVEGVLERGAREACLMVVDGRPGLGKTATVTWWAVQQGAVLVRAKAGWTPTWMLKELIEAMGGTPRQNTHEVLFRQVVEMAAGMQTQSERDGRVFGVVVDEVDHLFPESGRRDRKERARIALETLRDLSDLLAIPIVLTGMGRVRGRLTEYPQVASRVARYVEFAPAGAEDVRLMARELCECPVADDLVATLTRASKGLAREVMEGLARIETVGRRVRREVTLADFQGKVLLNDRWTGREIVVEAQT